MTAAVAAPEVAGPESPPLEHVPLISRPLRRPYLTAVPESEPPFDDEIAGPGRSVVRPVRADRAIPLDPGWTDSPARANSGAAPQDAGGPSGSSPPNANRRVSPVATTLRTPIPSRPAGRSGRSTAPGPPTLVTASARQAPTTIAAADVPPWSSESDIGVRRTATGDLPSAQRAASVLARALVEVLSGQRAVAQLRVHCSPAIYAGLLERPTVGRLALPHLLTVRLCEPADGVAEVSAAFRRADRVRAIAFRIEGVDGRWRITALQVG